MQRWKKSIPDGTRDILFGDCADKIDIEQKLRKLYLQRGYVDIITPTIEFYDVFDDENVWNEQENMYKLFDSKGRILVLRPDITTPIARISGTKLRESYYPLRFCYSQNVFRTNYNLNGKKNEFTQSGIEIIGVDSFKADVEVIVTAIRALIEIGIKDFKVELGQIQFFKGIMEDTVMDEESIERIRGYIENKNFASLKDFLESKKEFLDEDKVYALNNLPKLFGDISVIEKAKELTKNAKALEALKNIEAIYNILQNMGLSQYFSVDLGMVHHIDYYTGIIFRAYIEGAGNFVLYGGRYDSLIQKFGPNIPATGFAINVDSIVENIKKQGFNENRLSVEYLIYFDTDLFEKANALAEEIINKGGTCELALLEGKNENIKYAQQKKIKQVIILEDNKEILIYSIESKSTSLYASER